MSAGRGVTHSEFNPSQSEETRFLQIWLMPAVANTEPAYDTMNLSSADKDGKLVLFLSPDGRNGSMKTQADANVYAATLNGDQSIIIPHNNTRKGWLQVVHGMLVVNGMLISQGDGLAIEGSGALKLEQATKAEVIFFDLAP